MNIIAVLVILSVPSQVSRHLPVTIEVKRDVEVMHNAEPYETRGILYLDDPKAKAFTLKKGQKFKMIKIGPEGGCEIRFGDQNYGLTSCPWMEGFSDHQTDVFTIIGKK
jgi:hypothetical protein